MLGAGVLCLGGCLERGRRDRPGDHLTLEAASELPDGSRGFAYSDHDRFLIRQRLRLAVNQYEIFLPGPDGSEGEMIGFVRQKLAALKEDLRAYTDPSQERELFRIKARRVFDPSARYEVTDEAGNHIGELGKAFARSLARSTWRVYAPDGLEVAHAEERSLLWALVRRLTDLAGLIPIVGDVIQLIPIRYHFDIYSGERKIGSFERLFSFRDRYVLDLAGDVEGVVDRRVALALAIGMDSLQSR